MPGLRSLGNAPIVNHLIGIEKEQEVKDDGKNKVTILMG